MILKTRGKWCFSYETKASIHLSYWGEWICGAQSLKEERLLWESVFVQTDEWTLIPTMVEREVFLMKRKHQYHLSQWEEYVYCLQSWKERILLRESMFILIDRWTLILKHCGKWTFFYESKALIHLSQSGEWICGAQSLKERYYYVNPCLS